MKEGFLVGRISLRFDADPKIDVRADLSAVALDDQGDLWLASDEKTGVERLRPGDRGVFDDPRYFDLADPLDLAKPEDKDDEIDEIDIEGMDVDGSALWITGSHTSTRKKTKGKNDRKDLKRLAKVTRKLNRYVVARIPVSAGEPAGTIAHLPFVEDGNALTHALRDDPHLGPFLHIPGPDERSVQLASKENGFDIEGLAVHGNRVFLGLRGPVLRGWAALLLEIQPKDVGNGVLALDPIGTNGRSYRKHFVNLGGMGPRDLCWIGDDLLILAGPTMDLTGLQTVWRFRDAADLDDDSITDSDDKKLKPLFDLPVVRGADKAEGIELYDGLDEPGIMVIYDSPSEERQPDDRTVFADVFRLEKP